MAEISILLPVYNGEKHLAAAIRSVMGQEFRDWELIIIDDGSIDSSRKIAEGFRDQRVRFLANDSNKGVAVRLNEGISLAQGRYIARMDGDDRSRPHRLQYQWQFLESNKEVSIVGSAVQCFGERNEIYHYPQTHEECLVDLLFKPCFAHPAVMWRKDDLINQNLWYQENPPTAEDYDLWERASQVLKMANLPEVLLDYRVDATVKISAYLQQQDYGHIEVKKRLLESLGLPTDAKSMNEYIAFSSGPKGKAVEPEDRFLWGEKIYEANLSLELYDEELLLERIHSQYYGMMLGATEEVERYRNLYKNSSLPFSRIKKSYCLGKSYLKQIF